MRFFSEGRCGIDSETMLLITRLYIRFWKRRHRSSPALSKAGPYIRYQDGPCWLACLECWRGLAAVERVLPSSEKQCGGDRVRGPPAAHALSAALWSSNRCQQNQRFAQTIALCRGAGREHAKSMLESTVSFPAIFFAAIIGVIVFIALSELFLDPHE